MSRIVLSVLLGAVAVACGGDGTSKPGADQVAGKVIEVAGAVSAERGGETRTLTTGAQVFGGDTIKTAADGSVTIEIDHNQARWTLGAGKTRRLDESVVWNAPKASKAELLARAQTDKTVAAGRHAEKASAGTTATASAPTASAPPAPPAAAPSGDNPMPRGESKGAPRVAKPEPPTRRPSRKRARQKRAKPSKASKPSPAKISALMGGGPGGPGGLNRGTGTEGRRGGNSDGAGIGIGTTGGGGSPPPPRGSKNAEKRIKTAARVGKISVTAGKLDANVAGRVVRVRVRSLRACYDSALKSKPGLKGRLIFTLNVAATGVVARASVSGARDLLAATKSCLVARLRRIRFPKASDGGASTVVAIATFSTVD